MPEISVPGMALLAGASIVAAIVAWLVRGLRCKAEERALNADWRNQLDAQQAESDRLIHQNASLMEQLSRYQASNTDARNRARELADSLRDAMEQRDELQRQLKELRGKLARTTAHSSSLHTDVERVNARQQAVATSLREKDDKIARLKRELSNWYDRVPPLVARYRARNLEARELESALEQARTRIAELDRQDSAGDTRIETLDSVPERLDASNDQYEETSRHDMSGFDDQPLTPPGFSGDTDSYANFSDHDVLPRDDLKRIKGIGPAIEKTLNELGFYRFDQIADLSDHDVARIAERLRGFSSRMRREDWTGQARMLRLERNDHPA
jgi:predicted  nucleic acid-binding Zn-ribbon protein